MDSHPLSMSVSPIVPVPPFPSSPPPGRGHWPDCSGVKLFLLFLLPGFWVFWLSQTPSKTSHLVSAQLALLVGFCCLPSGTLTDTCQGMAFPAMALHFLLVPYWQTRALDPSFK